MKCLYVETSAVLSWLLGEQAAPRVIHCINDTEILCTSVLTRLEVERSLLRAENSGIIKAAERQKVRGLFQAVSASWSFLPITADVLARASGAFPVEPVRSLDAIHLASALELVMLYPDIAVLSFDRRIIGNLEGLGLAAYQLHP